MVPAAPLTILSEKHLTVSSERTSTVGRVCQGSCLRSFARNRPPIAECSLGAPDLEVRKLAVNSVGPVGAFREIYEAGPPESAPAAEHYAEKMSLSQREEEGGMHSSCVYQRGHVFSRGGSRGPARTKAGAVMFLHVPPRVPRRFDLFVEPKTAKLLLPTQPSIIQPFVLSLNPPPPVASGRKETACFSPRASSNHSSSFPIHAACLSPPRSLPSLQRTFCCLQTQSTCFQYDPCSGDHRDQSEEKTHTHKKTKLPKSNSSTRRETTVGLWTWKGEVWGVVSRDG